MGNYVRNNKQNYKREKLITKETVGMILALFSLLMFLFMVTNFIFGDLAELYVRPFLLGLLGYTAYAAVVALFAVGILLVLDKKINADKNTVTGLSLSLFFAICFIHALTTKSYNLGSYGAYIQSCYSAGESAAATTGGGFIFALFVYPFAKIITFLGAYIFFALCIIASLLYMFKVSLAGINEKLSLVSKKSKSKNVPISGYVDYSVPERGNGNSLYTGGSEFELKNKKELNAKTGGGLKTAFQNPQLSPKDPYETYNIPVSNNTYSENYAQNMTDKAKYILTPPPVKTRIEQDAEDMNTGALQIPKEERPPKIFHDNERDILNKDNLNLSGEVMPNSGFSAVNSPRRRRSTNNNNQDNLFNLFAEKQEEIKKESGMPAVAERIKEDNTSNTANTANSGIINGEELSKSLKIQQQTKKPEPEIPNIIVAKQITNDKLQITNEIPLNGGAARSDGVVNKVTNNEIRNTNDSQPAEKINNNFEEQVFTAPVKEAVNAVVNAENIAEVYEEYFKEEKKQAAEPVKPYKPYNYNPPPVNLLSKSVPATGFEEEIALKSQKIELTLEQFKIPAKVINKMVGPTVTRYELDMPAGIPVKKVAQFTDDLSLRLASKFGVRIEAPIPGTQLFGIEVPNDNKEIVGLRDSILSDDYINAKPKSLVFGLGKDVGGKNIICDITKMPHVLVAGSTGAGKSVCLNSIIISLLYRYSPAELRLILIDPKLVEFTSYNNIPHLMFNSIVTDFNKVIPTLTWLVNEMERRYKVFQEKQVRDIDEYNDSIDRETAEPMPRIVLIVDELADLMSMMKTDLEDRILRITQKSRAAGINLIVATQRPSVNIITGVIKANLPSRIAFRVISYVDSKTILDEQGAEKLLGMGDLLYKGPNMEKPIRAQGAFVSSNEVREIVKYIKENNPDAYRASADLVTAESIESLESDEDVDLDPLFVDSLRHVITLGAASISMIQRKFSTGYSRAGKIIDSMEAMGYISSFDGSKSRRVLITMDEFSKKYGKSG